MPVLQRLTDPAKIAAKLVANWRQGMFDQSGDVNEMRDVPEGIRDDVEAALRDNTVALLRAVASETCPACAVGGSAMLTGSTEWAGRDYVGGKKKITVMSWRHAHGNPCLAGPVHDVAANMGIDL